MSTAIRLAVFVVSSPRLSGWQEAITRHAAEAGWATSPPLSNDETVPADLNQLLVTHDIAALVAFAPTQCAVLIDSPDACLGPVAVAQAEGLRANEVRGTASASWAVASMLALEGATVADAQNPSIELPGLGQVTGPALSAAVECGQERGALAVFDALPVAVGATADWKPAQFDYPLKREFFGGTPDIDLTGRPRGLVYGPFVHLPAGVWQVDIDVSVDPERGRSPLKFEWGSGDNYVGTTSVVTVPGHYTLSLVHRFVESAPAQMRIWLTEGIFQGRMQFHGCRLTRAADDTPTTTPGA